MTIVSKCLELSCIYNKDEQCPFDEIELNEDGYCDKKEQGYIIEVK